MRMRRRMRFGVGEGQQMETMRTSLTQYMMSKGFLQAYFWRGDRNRFATTTKLSWFKVFE